MRGFLILLTCLTVVRMASGAERRIDLTKYEINSVPKEFQNTVTGEGKPGDWRVLLASIPSLMPAFNQQASNTVPGLVLAQLATDQTDEHFPLLILGNDAYGDFVASTRFKVISGKQEQMAGLAFRVQNPSNYYIVRVSVLGQNLRFYKFVDGQRSEPVGVNLPIDAQSWHELSIDCKGNQIKVLLDGKETLPTLTDYSFSNGKMALWTKSDTVAHFIDTKITYVPREGMADTLVRQAMERNSKLLGVKIYAFVGQPPELKVIASSIPGEIGQPGAQVERDVIGRDVPYAGKTGPTSSATLPLHDRNGEVVAAVRVVMRSIRGQSDQQILARALPIVKAMKPGIRNLEDLTSAF